MFVSFWLAGFLGAHHSNVPITPLDRDSAADPFDEADFELPDEKNNEPISGHKKTDFHNQIDQSQSISGLMISMLKVSSRQAGWYRGGIPDVWYTGALQQYSMGAKKTAKSLLHSGGKPQQDKNWQH